ncbi:hypothetical protein P3T17_000593 [Paraburkholderia sp. GAS82]
MNRRVKGAAHRMVDGAAPGAVVLQGRPRTVSPAGALANLCSCLLESLCRSAYLLTIVADSITIGVCGTSDIGPRVVVGVPSIFFTTSMPEVTLPNTA